MGWSARQPAFTVTTWMRSPALPQLVHQMQPIARRWAGSPAVRPSNPAPPHPYCQGQLSCFTQERFRALSPDCCSGYKREWGLAILLSCPQGLLVCPAIPTTRSILVCCSDRKQGLLPSALQPVRVRASSPTLATPGPALSSATGSNG